MTVRKLIAHVGRLSKLGRTTRVKNKGAAPHSFLEFGGERGIRTLERLPVAGFQDQCNRPLCHLSAGLLPVNAARLRGSATAAVCKSLQATVVLSEAINPL